MAAGPRRLMQRPDRTCVSESDLLPSWNMAVADDHTEGANPKAPERADALAAIDWELANLSEEQRALGATVWTLLAALGGVVWLLTGETLPWSEATNVAILFLGLSLLLDILMAIYSFCSPSPSSVPTPSYFQALSRKLGLLRVEMVFELVRTAVLYGCLLAGRGRLSVWLGNFLALFLYGRVFFIIVALTGSGLRLPIRVRDKGRSRDNPFRPYFSGFFMLAGIGLVSWFFWDYLKTKPQVPPASFRTAALAVVGAFLTSRLLVSLRPMPLKEFLTSLRRGTSVGAITPLDAFSQLRIAFVGMTGEEVVQQDTGVLLGSFTAVSEKIAGTVAWLDEQAGKAMAMASPTPAEKNAFRENFIQDHDRHTERIDKELGDTQRLYLKLQRKFRTFYGEDVAKHFEGVTEPYFTRIKAQAIDLGAKRKAFSEIVARIPTTSPPTPPGTADDSIQP
jgi:hypothetical protein